VAILREIYPEGLGEPSRAVTQARLPATTPRHELGALERAQRPDQNRAGDALALANDVEKVMRPVGEVDVGETRLPEHGAVAHRGAPVSVARRVLGPVGFGLDDDAGGEAFGGLVGQDAADEIDRDLPGVPVVEGGL